MQVLLRIFVLAVGLSMATLPGNAQDTLDLESGRFDYTSREEVVEFLQSLPDAGGSIELFAAAQEGGPVPADAAGGADISAVSGLIAGGMSELGHGGSEMLSGDPLSSAGQLNAQMARLLGALGGPQPSVFCRMVCESATLPACRKSSVTFDNALCVSVKIDEVGQWLPAMGLRQPDPGANKLAKLYGDERRDNEGIPSGYTFLGQFIDHDMSAGQQALNSVGPTIALAALGEAGSGRPPAIELDRLAIGVRLAQELGAAKLQPSATCPAPAIQPGSNGRSASLDLDSVYGPFQCLTDISDRDERNLFEFGGGAPTGKFRLRAVSDAGLDGFDFIRKADGKAFIVDGRNDENKLIASIHAMFLVLHNLCIDHYQPMGAADAYTRCRTEVPWVHQTIVLTDYLPRTLNADFAQALVPGGKLSDGQAIKNALSLFDTVNGQVALPESFGVAGFRMGHSQLRRTYQINATGSRELFAPMEAPFGAGQGNCAGIDLRGRCKLIGRDLIQQALFFDMNRDELQFSRKIDLQLTSAVALMPKVALPSVDNQIDTPNEQNLARRNILRSAETTELYQGPPTTGVGLPSAATYLAAFAQAIHPYPGDLPAIEAALKAAGVPQTTGTFLEGVPLWLFVLAEAQTLENGERLGPLGSLIVGEVIAGAIAFDDHSVVNADLSAATWPPIQTIASTKTYGMPDMIRYIENTVPANLTRQ